MYSLLTLEATDNNCPNSERRLIFTPYDYFYLRVVIYS